MELNPKQNFSYAEIKKVLPSLQQLDIKSPNLSTEQQKLILNDFKQHKFPYIRVNGNTYSSEIDTI